jgi:ArsR family transcriptional regulator, lead/cadmium/zinc/bismuth-responsive transcriptional repressor
MIDDDLTCEQRDHTPPTATWLPLRRDLETAADMFRALADPLRLRLLSRLAVGEACVTELAALEGDKLTTISARLQALHGARLVKRRRDARHVFYALADEHVLLLVQSAIGHATERIAADQAPVNIKETK